jgi:hypothetical protein
MRFRITLALLSLGFLAACNKWSDARVAETKRRGDIICHAIDAYRTKTGKYPFQLKELQPEFLHVIPQPSAGGKEWQYTVVDNGTDYYLQVFGDEFGPILGRRKEEKWDYIK